MIAKSIKTTCLYISSERCNIEVHCVSALARLLHFLPINFTHHITEKIAPIAINCMSKNPTLTKSHIAKLNPTRKRLIRVST